MVKNKNQFSVFTSIYFLIEKVRFYRACDLDTIYLYFHQITTDLNGFLFKKLI